MTTTTVFFDATTTALFYNQGADVQAIKVILMIIVVFTFLDFIRRWLMPRAW